MNSLRGGDDRRNDLRSRRRGDVSLDGQFGLRRHHNSSVAFGPQSGSPLGSGTQQTWNSNVSTAALPAGSYLDLDWTVNAPDAANSPQTVDQSVTVDAHSVPVIWSYSSQSWVAVPSAAEAQSPSPDPLAFGATGGGETFSAAAPNVIGDPPAVPTAGLALNYVNAVGAPQITSNFATFANLAPMPIGDENPAEGDAFNVWCNVTQPGTFSKIFYLGFSDEQDLPGADSPALSSRR